MKKKGKILTVITLSAICTGIITAVFPSFAEGGIESRGNFVLDNGEMALYTSDADYLQSDMDILYSELPALPDASFYGTARKSNIRSKGILDYASGTVVIDSTDFTFLADEIDALEYAYKANTANALNQIGTYFLADGSVTYNPDDAAGFTEGTAAMLSFDKLYAGILTSQSVSHLAQQQAVNASGELLYYASEAAKNDNSLVLPTTAENGLPLLIQASAAENISAGAAAWVNGKLLIGNGADNNAFYNQGYTDGFNKAVDGADISYVYHQHTGSAYVNGGCVYAWHEHTDSCPSHNGSSCGATLHETYHGHYQNEYGQWMCTYVCSNGHIFIEHHDLDGLSCPIHDVIYDCGNSPLNQWKYNCGKTTSTIESATLTFK